MIPKNVGAEFSREYDRAETRKIPVIFETFYAPLETWFEIYVYPSAEGTSIYFRDITQRKRAEEERNRLLGHERAIAEIAQALVRSVRSGSTDAATSRRIHGGICP